MSIFKLLNFINYTLYIILIIFLFMLLFKRKKDKSKCLLIICRIETILLISNIVFAFCHLVTLEIFNGVIYIFISIFWAYNLSKVKEQYNYFYEYEDRERKYKEFINQYMNNSYSNVIIEGEFKEISTEDNFE